MEFVEIEFGSGMYKQELQLREQLLRQPLGLVLTAEDMMGEDTQLHYGIVQDGELIACVLVKILNAQDARLRQMVVAPQMRKAGIGSRLLAEVETLLVQKGVARITLHARLAAMPFYRKAGYAPEGEPFTEIGIPHVRMVKDLQDS